jgi:hypothetical protein
MEKEGLWRATEISGLIGCWNEVLVNGGKCREGAACALQKVHSVYHFPAWLRKALFPAGVALIVW